MASLGFISSQALGNHLVEHVDLRCLGARVPVFDGAAGVKDEVVLLVRLLDEWFARDEVQLGSPVGGEKYSVCVEALAAPLHATRGFDLFPGESAVVAHAASRDALPLAECVMRG